MITAWTQHITNEDEKQRYLKSLKNAKWAFDDLSKMLDKHDADLETQEISPRSYDNANWPYRQAHTNGYRQAIRTIQKIINLDQKETK